MSKTLVAHEEPLSKIFSDDYVFRIPSYQRPYAWATEQGRELFEDLLGSITRKKNGAASNYDFDTKKQAYFSKNGISPFVMTTQVLDKSEWTMGVVSQHQKDLLAVLERDLRLEGRKSPEELGL